MSSHPYRLDKDNARWLGVCSGLAEKTGIDATFVRASVVIATILALGPVAVLIYLVTALAAGTH